MTGLIACVFLFGWGGEDLLALQSSKLPISVKNTLFQTFVWKIWMSWKWRKWFQWMKRLLMLNLQVFVFVELCMYYCICFTLFFMVFLCSVSSVKMKGNFSFCWYWWNWWPSLFKLSIHNCLLCHNDDKGRLVMKFSYHQIIVVHVY